MKPKFFLVNKPQIDFFTMTFYGDEWLARCLDELGIDEGAGKPNKIRYYVGEKFDCGDRGSIAYGWAVQKGGRDHFILTSEGDIAHDSFFELSQKEVNATRIDLQITILRTSKASVTRDFADNMRGGEWAYKPRKVTLIEGDQGEGNTLYIGSRQSERFIRFYEKLGTDGRWYVRYEVELKGGLAQDAYFRLMRGGDKMIAPMLLAELQMIPYVPEVADFLELWRTLQVETWCHWKPSQLKQAQSVSGSG